MQNQYRSYNSINRMHIFFWLLIINNSLIFYLDIYLVYLFFPTSFNPFLVNISFFTPSKKLENIWFSGVFRGKKMGTLVTNRLKPEYHCISGNTPNITKSSSNLDYGKTFQKEVTNIYELINIIFFKIFNLYLSLENFSLHKFFMKDFDDISSSWSFIQSQPKRVKITYCHHLKLVSALFFIKFLFFTKW